VTLRKFLALGGGERMLVVRCACVLVLARLGLCMLSVRRLHALLAARPPARRAPASPARHSAERVAWAVRAAARYVPGATCLPQALTAVRMLLRHGHPAELRIGVVRADDGRLAGHAWVESDGAIVIGGDHPLRYTPVPVLEGWSMAQRCGGAGR